MSVLTVASIAVFVAGLAKKDTSSLVLDGRAFMGEPWRVFTTVLPHVNALHLAFNVLWLVRLGVPIERQIGTLRFALLAVMLGCGASLAEYALAGIGVGLSGIGYGLVAFGWVLRGDPRFSGIVDRRTAVLFLVWFFFCIGTTVAGVMPVANVAHGAGALLGGRAALVYQPRRPVVRVGLALVGAGLLVLFWLGATTLRPRVNLSAGRGSDSAYLGWKHLDAREDAVAEPFLREAVRVAPEDGSNWFNLGIALERQDKTDEALDAYRRAHHAAPDNSKYTSAFHDALHAAALKAMLTDDDAKRAMELCREGLPLDVPGGDRGERLFEGCLTLAEARWRAEEQAKNRDR